MRRTGLIVAIGGGFIVLGALYVGAKLVWSSVFAPAQVLLTQEQIDGVVAVEKEMARLSAEMPQTSKIWDQAKAGIAMGRKLGAFEKAHGFADAMAFNRILHSVQTVQNGIDPATKKYRGPAFLEKTIADLQKDTSIPDDRKTPLLQLYRDQLNTLASDGPPPPGNVALVEKNYDKLQGASTSPE